MTSNSLNLIHYIHFRLLTLMNVNSRIDLAVQYNTNYTLRI